MPSQAEPEESDGTANHDIGLADNQKFVARWFKHASRFRWSATGDQFDPMRRNVVILDERHGQEERLRAKGSFEADSRRVRPRWQIVSQMATVHRPLRIWHSSGNSKIGQSGYLRTTSTSQHSVVS
jgi:hypothetical protein